jgi:NAD(P)-dependent dehydrogenase (short-subunit alcohol dehydrogenase family)
MRELIDFSGQTAVVTGGASEIGKAIGNEFAKEGADVVLSDIDDERGEEGAEQIAADHDVDVQYVHGNVSDLESCEELVDTVVEEFGGIDVLVNSAAVAAPSAIAKPFLEETPDDWNAQLHVTIMAAVHPTYAALPHMIEQGGGAIVNFSSESYKGQDNKLAMYGAAKSAVATFTKTLSKEFGGDDIRINAISPSATRTAATSEWMDKYGDTIVEEHALNRLGRPEDHANAVLFLASDAADWITGEVLSVNGGYL